MTAQDIKPALYWPCDVCKTFVSGRRIQTGRVFQERREVLAFGQAPYEPSPTPVVETIVVCRWCGTPEGTGQVITPDEYRAWMADAEAERLKEERT
jgi:hypothetical protein